MCGCSVDEKIGAYDREIRLGASGDTRAVGSLADLAAVGDNIGIFGIESSDPTGIMPQEGWDRQLWLMDNVRTSSVEAKTGAIHWLGSYLYPADKTRYVRFTAYHPYSDTAPDDGQGAPARLITITGAEDVMFAGPVVGNAATPPPPMVFEHRLTQIAFRVADAEGEFLGQTLSAITVTGANTSAVMEMAAGSLTAWGRPADITVPGIGSVTIKGTPDAPQNVGSEVMLQPGCDTFRLNVATSLGTFRDVVIRPTSSVGGAPEKSFAAGRAYMITLTFHKRQQIEIGATVVPWQMAGTGSAVIQ